MKTFRNTLLGACLALPLLAVTGQAQPTPPNGGRVIYVPAGATVVILPGPGTVAAPNMVNAGAPEAMPLMQMIAQQQAAMQRMIANMNAMFPPLPDPNRMLRAAFGAGGPLNVSIMPMAGGHGVCSQSISIVERGDGSAPIVKTSQSGDACGALGSASRKASTRSVRCRPRWHRSMVRRCWRSATRRTRSRPERGRAPDRSGADIPGSRRRLETADGFREHVLRQPKDHLRREDRERDRGKEDHVDRQAGPQRRGKPYVKEF